MTERIGTFSLSRDKSRLEDALYSLTGTGIAPSHRPLLDWLSNTIGLADAVSLSAQLRGVDPVSGNGGSALCERVSREVLEARLNMARFILASFGGSAGSETPFVVPGFSDRISFDGLDSKQRFQRFYSLHQNEMEIRVHELRLSVRAQVARHSATMARLVALDKTVGQGMTVQLGKSLALIPGLLGVHFPMAGDTDGDEIGVHQTAFVENLKELLLGELDMRLQPVFGLVESLY